MLGIKKNMFTVQKENIDSKMHYLEKSLPILCAKIKDICENIFEIYATLHILYSEECEKEEKDEGLVDDFQRIRIRRFRMRIVR